MISADRVIEFLSTLFPLPFCKTFSKLKNHEHGESQLHRVLIHTYHTLTKALFLYPSLYSFCIEINKKAKLNLDVKNLIRIRTAASPTSILHKEELMRCGRCNTEVKKEHKFCHDCGNYLGENAIKQRLLAALEHESHGQIEQAINEYRAVLEIDPNNVIARKLLGACYFGQGMIDWAIEQYRKTTEIDPRYADAYYGLGVTLYYRARMSEAIEALKKVLEINPDHRAAHYRLGLVYHHLGLHDEGITHLQKSTAITPDYVMAHYHLGVIYEKNNRWEDATREFNKIVERNPQDAASYYHLAMLHHHKGDTARAKEYLKEALNYEPENKFLKRLAKEIGG